MKKWLCLGFCLAGLVMPAAAVTDEEIDAAIVRMRDWIYSKQDAATGSWDLGEKVENSKNVTGPTALTVYALLTSGESYQDTRIRRALDFLREYPGQGTYTVALRAHIWAALPDEFRPMLETEARWLLSAHNEDGLFHYTAEPPKTAIDHSTTQYGILGLWEFRKRGGRVDPRLWANITKHFNKYQTPDGGWAYNPKGGQGNQPRGSMTAAGLTVLLVAQQEILRDRKTPEPTITQDINEALDWLDKNFKADSNVNGGHYYYYAYGIERVGLAAGISQLNGKDWFESIAQELLKREKGKGFVGGDKDTLDTAFALAFLSRGRVPLWVSKLQLPNANWNNRPNDIYFLTRFLSDQRESELNWQVVSFDIEPESWLKAPVLYVSSDEALRLDEAQQAKLKRYLDLGGMLLVNPESGGSGLEASVKELAQKMYPRYSFEPVTGEHPLANLVVDLRDGRPTFRSRVETLHNGARDLIVIADSDWGYEFQAKDPGKGEAWGYIMNLYTLATNRGRLTNRLTQVLPEKEKRSSTGSIPVARAEYDGNWQPEPLALEVAGTSVFNQSGKTLELSVQPLDQLDNAAELVHLAGTEKVELTDAQKDSIKNYLNGGGTILVETVGGIGDFGDEMGHQIAELMGTSRQWLDVFSPVIDGTGIEGAKDVSAVQYRMHSIISGAPPNRPELGAVFVDNRPAVIVSPRDLSAGVLGSRYYRINGYRPESAREIFTNIVLFAAQD